MNSKDLIGQELLDLLYSQGFVVVHSVPTESMHKAGGSLGEYHYYSPSAYWHRMVAESIRLQKVAKNEG